MQSGAGTEGGLIAQLRPQELVQRDVQKSAPLLCAGRGVKGAAMHEAGVSVLLGLLGCPAMGQ